MNSMLTSPFLRAATVAALCTQLAVPVAMFPQEAMQSTDAAKQDDSMARGRVPIPMPEATALDSNADLQLQKNLNTPLKGDDRILLVLDRFTYGPRPGDLEHVKQIGLAEWFKEQLNPQTINDSALDERLKAYPAMTMPLGEMMRQFPSNDMIRRAAKGDADAPGPSGPNHVPFEDRVAAYKNKKSTEAKDAKETAKSPAPASPDMMAATDATKKDKKADFRQEAKDVSLPASVDEIAAMPADKRFNFILHLSTAQMYELRHQAAKDQTQLTAGFTPTQMETMQSFNGPSEVIAQEAVETKLVRDIYSERQLQEVMVDFWLNHFNLYMKKNDRAPYYIAAFERDVIRPRALGNFTNLLMATATSPAMLEYLDQYLSVGPKSPDVHPALTSYNNGNFQPAKTKKDSGLNENYAREVMELHTVGVDAGYSQKDVTEMAKVLTGWTVDKNRNSDEPTQVVFDARKHEPGTKEVFGQTIKEDGVNEGIKMLKYLASTPQCAHFISQKLAVRFVSDNPPKAMVDRMAATFLATHGDIRHVLATMVNSPEFFTAASYRTKVKTPVDFVVSAVRATNADVDNPQALAKAVSDLGMPLYGHQTPEGYSMKSDAWNSTNALIERMNFSMALASNRVQGVHADLGTLVGPDDSAMTPKQKQDQIEARLLHAPVSARTETLIAKETMLPSDQQSAQLKQVSTIRGSGKLTGKSSKSSDKRSEMSAGGVADVASLDTQAAMATGLVLGSPEFQRR